MPRRSHGFESPKFIKLRVNPDRARLVSGLHNHLPLAPLPPQIKSEIYPRYLPKTNPPPPPGLREYPRPPFMTALLCRVSLFFSFGSTSTQIIKRRRQPNLTLSRRTLRLQRKQNAGTAKSRQSRHRLTTLNADVLSRCQNRRAEKVEPKKNHNAPGSCSTTSTSEANTNDWI